MPSQEDLKKLRVLVTRPKPQGQLLCEQLQAQGFITFYLPTIDIELPQDVVAFQRAIMNLNQMNWLIFVSPQAVFQSASLIHSYWPMLPINLKLAAIGTGTANAMQELNLPVEIYPKEDWRSEGLLNLPEFHDVHGQRIGIISGEGGREWLERELINRGAQVTKIMAYRRGLPSVDMSQYLNLLQKDGVDIIICSSEDGLKNLKTLLNDEWIILQDIPVLVISQRLAESAEQLGFKQVIIAKNVGLGAILEAITRYRKKL